MSNAYSKAKNKLRELSKEKYIISEDVAVDQVVSLFDYYDIDPDTLEAEMDAAKEEKMITLGFKQMFDRFLRAIRTGHLEIVEHESIPTFKVHLRNPTNGQDSQEITFKPRGYYDDRQERNLSDDANITVQTLTKVACMVEKPVAWVEKLKQHDRSLVEVIGHFFSAM